MEHKDEMFKMRIEGSQEAIKRARLVFLILTIASLAVAIAVWNTYFSWERDFALHKDFPIADSPVTEHVQKELITEWVKTGTIGVSLLGISVRVSDASLLGSLSIFILSIWLFFCARRENHTVGRLLMDSMNETVEMRQMIFHGVCSALVFITVGPDDEPISGLEAAPTLRKHHRVLLRKVVRALFFLGPASVFFVLFADVASIFFVGAAARYPHDALIHHVKDIDAASWWKMGLMELAGFGLGISSGFISWQVLRFEKGTSKVLEEYRNKLETSSGPV